MTMNNKQKITIIILSIFVIGMCIGAVDAAHTVTKGKYSVKLTDKTLAEDPNALTQTARSILSDPKRREDMSRRIAKFADPNANQRIWDDIQTLVSKKKEEK